MSRIIFLLFVFILGCSDMPRLSSSYQVVGSDTTNEDTGDDTVFVISSGGSDDASCCGADTDSSVDGSDVGIDSAENEDVPDSDTLFEFPTDEEETDRPAPIDTSSDTETWSDSAELDTGEDSDSGVGFDSDTLFDTDSLIEDTGEEVSLCEGEDLDDGYWCDDEAEVVWRVEVFWPVDWSTSYSSCIGLEEDGFDNWRLPTLSESESILRNPVNTPSHLDGCHWDEDVFGEDCYDIWVFDGENFPPAAQLSMNYQSGETKSRDYTQTLFAFCVRGL